MLTCLPQSLCSWNFRVEGAAAGPAELEFSWFSEQGRIRLGGHEFQIHKNGPLSGRWVLEHLGKTIARAHKPSAFFRSFIIEGEKNSFSLDAESAFTRCYGISSEGHKLGTIRAAHALTRRATIECDPGIPEILQLFSFWLVVITWRRAASNNAANGS